VTTDAYVIRVKSDFSITVETNNNGVISTKAVSADELEKSLINSMVNTDVTSGLLPKNCLSWTKSSKSDASYYVIRHTKNYADIQYHDTVYNRFPIPNLVFGFRLNGNKVVGVGIGVIGTGEISENTEMYHYPFSNVSGFSMCTGGNRLPTVKKTSALANLPYFILGLPDNDDRYNENHNKPKLGHRELLEHLKDKTPEYYYTDILVKSKNTLKDFI